MAHVLVLGGSGGIGSAVVRRYAADGRDVHFTYLKADATAQAVADSCTGSQGTVTYEQLDVRDSQRVDDVVEACGADLSVVVFSTVNAAITKPSGAKPKHWDWTLDTNVRGFGVVYRAALPYLARNRGSIVALTSVGSRTVLPGYALIGAAKAATESMVRYFAVEAGALGVRVNAVCPGVIDTRALQAFPGRERHLRDAVMGTPLGRLVTCDEIATVIRWLTGQEGAMITGQTLVVDGGWELTGLLSEPLAGELGE